MKRFDPYSAQFPHNVSKTHKTPGLPADFIELKGADQAAFNGRWQVTAPELDDPESRVLEFQMSSPPGTATGAMTVEQSFQPMLRVRSAVVNGARTFMTITTARKQKGHKRRHDLFNHGLRGWARTKGTHRRKRRKSERRRKNLLESRCRNRSLPTLHVALVLDFSRRRCIQ